MAETAHFMGEGGVIWTFDLPLTGTYEKQAARRRLQRVNADGSAYNPDPEPAPEPEDDESPVEELVEDVTATLPPLNGSKAAWVDYAVSQGMDADDAEAATRGDLIDLFG